MSSLLTISPTSQHNLTLGHFTFLTHSPLQLPSSSPKHQFCCRPKWPLLSLSAKLNKLNALQQEPSSSLADQEDEQNDQEDDFQVLTAIRTAYNDIVIAQTRQSRMLLLDSTQNVHSIVNKGEKWTDSYWDEFASLPAIVPDGPIAIYGLGGGTAAQLMLDSWPALQLEGWEIDEILIEKARQYLGLSDLEKHTPAGGVLHVHGGDVFSETDAISGHYAGIVVDLFSDGKVLPQLQEVDTWLQIKSKLMLDGRIMVNCGGADDTPTIKDGQSYREGYSTDAAWMRNSAICAMSKAFPGQLSWKRVPEVEGGNYLALTGPLPDVNSWSAKIPSYLRENVKLWRTCRPTTL